MRESREATRESRKATAESCEVSQESGEVSVSRVKLPEKRVERPGKAVKSSERALKRPWQDLNRKRVFEMLYGSRPQALLLAPKTSKLSGQTLWTLSKSHLCFAESPGSV